MTGSTTEVTGPLAPCADVLARKQGRAARLPPPQPTRTHTHFPPRREKNLCGGLKGHKPAPSWLGVQGPCRPQPSGPALEALWIPSCLPPFLRGFLPSPPPPPPAVALRTLTIASKLGRFSGLRCRHALHARTRTGEGGGRGRQAGTGVWVMAVDACMPGWQVPPHVAWPWGEGPAGGAGGAVGHGPTRPVARR